MQSQYMEALIDTAAKEKDFIDPLVTLLHEQLNYHRVRRARQAGRGLVARDIFFLRGMCMSI